MSVIQVMGKNRFARLSCLRNDFSIRGAGHANIPHMTTNMTAPAQRRDHVTVHIHVEQEFHPATEPGMGNILSSIAHEAYASAW